MAQQKQQVEIEPGKGAVVTFDAVKIPDALQLDVQVTATAGDHRDALVTRLPVLPWGLEYADNKGGLGRGDQTVFLNLPEGITYSNRWLTVLIGPVLEKTVIEMALDSGPPIMPLTRLADTRAVPPVEVYGSSVGSELLAAVSGFAYARAHTVPERDVAELRSRCLSLLATLVSTQRDDGAWAWHAGTGAQPDWAATSRAYWALARAREAGLSVHPDAFTKAGAYLENQFRKFSANDNDGKAAVLHALSTSKQADFAHLNRLYRERNSLSNSALAYSALAFINLERREMARELTDLLVSRAAAPADETVPRAYWQHGVKHHPWLQDDLETTALTLLALALVDPESPKAEAAAQYLLQQRGCIGFRPAKARGPAVRALAAYYSTGQEATADYRVTINVNGQELTEVNSAEASTSQVFAIPENMLKDGENTVTFTMVGRGRYTYAATLRGFSAELKDPNSWPRPHIYDRHYYHSRLEYRGRQIGSRSSSPVRHLESGQRTEVFLNFYESHFGGYLIIEEPLPAGTMLVEGSPSGNYTHYEVGQSKITFFYQAGAYPNDIRYELVGYAPGDFRALPTVMRDAMNPGRMRLGKVSQLAVLRPGEVSSDPYHMNYGELFELGQLNFEDGIYDQALEYLTQLFKQNRGYNERDVARMLLWIHTDPRYYDAERIVEMFEILRERYPQLEIPFDKILVVGRAYRDIGEFERAWLVFRATIEASFISDSNVSAVLEDQGRFLGSIDYQGRLWREYPDSAQVVSAYFALSQALYNKAPQAHAMPEETGRKPDRIEMLEDTAGMLTQFLTLYPNDPLADDAAFSLANAYLDLKQYEFVVHLSRRFAEQYAASKLVSSFQYMMALGLFWQRDYEAALEAAQVVATGDSQDKMFAQYIVGQIYHAQGLPGQAIEWYGKVKGQYPDAAEAIGYFEKAAIGLGEINIYRPGEKIELPLEYRNIREAHLQIYRVDLMRLYLREKNLSNISRVHLAGIEPEAEMTVQLGDGKDYVDQDTDIQLDLKDEGAYLVICRGDDLFTSGLVLITPLKVEVQEDAVSGQVRVNVRDVVEETYQADVHVKVVGSEDKEFRSGDTDLRGIFVAGNVRGKATVIAREGEARYAFYRGDQWLGAPAHEPQQQAPQQQPQAAPLDYQRNLRDQNMMMQRENVQQFDQMRRVQQKGVEVQKAF